MPNIKHQFVSAKSDGGDATLVKPSDWNAEHLVDQYLDYDEGSHPSAPGTDTARLYAYTMAGNTSLWVRSVFGQQYPLQGAFYGSNIWMLLPATGTAPALLGIPNNATGTASHPALASTNMRTASRRINFVSGTTASSGAGTRSNLTMVWLGNAAGLGGFLWHARIGLSAAPASVTNAFVGFHSATAVITAGTEPSALTNTIGFGFDRADTSWQFMRNDASGTATKTALGVNFPINTTSLFDFFMYAPPNSGTVWWHAFPCNTTHEASGSAGSDLPANTTFLASHVYVSMNSGTTACGIDVCRLYIETRL